MSDVNTANMTYSKENNTESTQEESLLSEFCKDFLPIIGNAINALITMGIGVGIHLISLAVHNYILRMFNVEQEGGPAFLGGAMVAGGGALAAAFLHNNREDNVDNVDLAGVNQLN